MGRYVEMDKWSLTRFCLDAGKRPVAASEAESDGRTLPLPASRQQFIVTVTVCPFLHAFPCIFLGCDRVNLK